MFEEKLVPEEIPKASKSSQLSQLLEDTMYQPSNPYLDYAKFDGEVKHITKKFVLTFLCIIKEQVCIPPCTTKLKKI